MLASLKHPARLIPLVFLIAIAAGTLLLFLPIARAGPGGAPLLVALFTATSAVCVTGLVVVDTATYWSGFGQAIILALIQVGGFGIMTGATMLGLLVTRRLGLSRRLLAQAETRTFALGDVVSVLRLILLVTIATEMLVAAVLTLRFTSAYDQDIGEALWNGVFHAVSAFNNAGFARYADSVMGFAADPVVLGPLMVAIVAGALGFPVIYELRHEWCAPRQWSLHTKLTLLGTALLLVAGFAATLAFEWRNPATLGPLGIAGKVLNALFHSVNTRTAGFNSLDIAGMRPQTLLFSDALMMVGGGSAGTAGGIKVTTFLILGLVVWSEIRGEPDSSTFGRRISREVQRQALTVALLAIGTVGVATLALLSLTSFGLSEVLFEAVSAFATVGLSTGITARLPASGQMILVLLMFVGRVGTITAATALALKTSKRPYRYPEERPIVG